MFNQGYGKKECILLFDMNIERESQVLNGIEFSIHERITKVEISSLNLHVECKKLAAGMKICLKRTKPFVRILYVTNLFVTVNVSICLSKYGFPLFLPYTSENSRKILLIAPDFFFKL